MQAHFFRFVHSNDGLHVFDSSPLVLSSTEEETRRSAANATRHRPSRQKVTRLLPLPYRSQQGYGLIMEPLHFPWLRATPPMRMLANS